MRLHVVTASFLLIVCAGLEVCTARAQEQTNTSQLSKPESTGPIVNAWEPKTGAVGSLWDVVRDRRLNHRPEVVGGVLAAECTALLDDFFAHQRLG